MNITIAMQFDEQEAIALLNWLARVNARQLRARPELPLLYDSCVVYRPEQDERWCDYLNLLAQGHEDCDGLAAARAGELMARGYQALRPQEPGYLEAHTKQLKTIPAEVYLTTHLPNGKTGLYHCVVKYRVGKNWYTDDPSKRLGMHGGVDPNIVRTCHLQRLNKTPWRTV
ncbi:MAG: hypothetical protein ACKO6N_21125 [Myxococcota bacterium]